ncbi:haloacid dehalogenase type II [Rhodovulum bhavnagarense]|nr:haloacid dehalogenase type II [Rhodovulum bhavnagarense]
MIAIHAQTERKRLDRSVRCAEKRRPWARKQRLRGLIRPDPAVCATAGAACGRKSLSSARIQAIFTSNDTPLGECRQKRKATKMTVTFAFDVYGTLINPHGITELIRKHVGDKAPQLSQLWREKQLEYSFRRGLMRLYRDFSVATENALDYASAVFETPLSEDAKAELLTAYRKLPAFDDTAPALNALHAQDSKMFAFSNGRLSDVNSLLENADVAKYLDGVISVDEIETFKPNPDVYAHFNKKTGSNPDTTWLVSSNPFDVIGARAVGWKAAWVQRTTTSKFDPWEIQPTKVISTLAELSGGVE